MRPSAPRSFIVTAGVIAAGFVLCLAADWPGALSYDSVIQLMEGRNGAYSNWHPAVMSWFLGLTDSVVRGTGLFMAADMALFFGALAGLLVLRPKPHWTAAVLAGLFILTPQVLVYQGTVWKDVLFANASVAGFVCLAAAAVFWPRPRLRFGLIAGALLLFALAALARQNGILVGLAGAVTLGWIAAAQNGAGKVRMAALYTALALVAGIAVTLGGVSLLALRSVGNSGPSAQIQLLQTYDVIGAAKADPGYKLGAVADDDEDLERIIRTVGVKVWSAERNDTLGSTPVLQNALDDADPGTMGLQWRDLVSTRPGLYLRVRASVFRWVFMTPDVRRCLPYEIGVDGPSPVLAELGLAERYDTRDEIIDHYAKLFIGTPVLSHVFYAVLALVALYILLRRRRPEDIAVAGLLASAFVVTASFFVISIACDYRYLYFLDIATMLALFYLALDAKDAWRVLTQTKTGAR